MKKSKAYFKCDDCKEEFSKEEYDDAWDWAGPHCPNPKCSNGGIKLFAKREGPIVSGKSFLNRFIKK